MQCWKVQIVLGVRPTRRFRIPLTFYPRDNAETRRRSVFPPFPAIGRRARNFLQRGGTIQQLFADATHSFLAFSSPFQAMTGVDASGNGDMTLSTLNLTRDYWRTSVESNNVLKCHQGRSLQGVCGHQSVLRRGLQKELVSRALQASCTSTVFIFDDTGPTRVKCSYSITHGVKISVREASSLVNSGQLGVKGFVDYLAGCHCLHERSRSGEGGTRRNRLNHLSDMMSSMHTPFPNMHTQSVLYAKRTTPPDISTVALAVSATINGRRSVSVYTVLRDQREEPG